MTELLRLIEFETREETAMQGGVNVSMVRVPGGGEGRWDSNGHLAETSVVWNNNVTPEVRSRTMSSSSGQCCIVAVKAEHRDTSCRRAEVVLFTQPG